MKYQDCYREGREALRNAGIAEADLDARLLLEFVCGTNRNDLLVHGDKEVETEMLVSYRTAIERRSEHIPLQHITGEQDFMGLSFRVNEHVLIPRQDTEILVEEVMRNMQEHDRILDMCTGSGCILISLLHYSNWCEGVGVDISAEALEIAKENALSLLTEEKYPTWLQSNLFETVEGHFDIIVSNPPYIRTEVIETLMPEVRCHEPMQALDGMSDGLFFYRNIVKEAPRYLKKEGRLYFEIGHDQAGQVSELMKQGGFSDIQVVKDYAGLDRVVYGTLI